MNKLSFGINTDSVLFTSFLKFIEKKTGMSFLQANYASIAQSINKRCEDLNIYAGDYLEKIKNNNPEQKEFLNTVTINETYFFREQKQIKVIQKYVLPDIFEKHKNANLWSVACSSGEEAFSLALLAEDIKRKNGNNYTIYATDLNTHALKILQYGEYGRNSFRTDGESFHYLLKKYCRQTPKGWQVSKNLINKVEVYPLNLYHDSFSILPDYINLAVLRNTLIYLNMEAREKIIEKVIDKMLPGGYMFLSSCEVYLGNNPQLELIENNGVYFFRKKKHIHYAKATVLKKSPILPPKNSENISLIKEKIDKQIFNNIKQEQAFDHDRIMQMANTIIATPDYEIDPQDTNQIIANLLLKANNFINQNKLDNARDIINNIEEKYCSNEFSNYLMGFIEMVANNKQKAIKHFRRALYYESGFWPANFYLAKLIVHSNPAKAFHEFGSCRKKIFKYINMEQDKYHFLLESFSAKYFLDMCEKMIKTLGNQ